MPVENPQFKTDLRKESRLPLLGEPLLTPSILESLKIAEADALDPRNVIAFLAGQSVKYNDIVSRPEIKAIEGEVPEYLHEDGAFLAMSSLTREEEMALGSWSDEVAHGGPDGGKGLLLGIQSGEVDYDSLKDQIQNHIDEMMKTHPELAQNSGGGGADPIEMMFVNEMAQESAEQKKKWQELIAAAKDPETLNTLMGMRYAQGVVKKIGRLVEMYKFHTDQMDRLSAQFELQNKAGTLSGADMASFNIDQARMMGDTSLISQMMTKAMTDYGRITEDTNKTNTDIGKPMQLMIQNMRS